LTAKKQSLFFLLTTYLLGNTCGWCYLHILFFFIGRQKSFHFVWPTAWPQFFLHTSIWRGEQNFSDATHESQKGHGVHRNLWLSNYCKTYLTLWTCLWYTIRINSIAKSISFLVNFNIILFESFVFEYHNNRQLMFSITRNKQSIQ